jgi:ATP-dependent Clp protease ATP-binding subunit ClpC
MDGYNFSERFRLTVRQAHQEALALRHEYIGTEHLLLALLRDRESVAASVLQRFSVDPDETRQVVLGTLQQGKSAEIGPDLPYTSRGKKTLQLAMSQAREWDHNYVGPEHMLIGLLREKNGIGGQVLTHVGVTLDSALEQTLSILGEQH